MPFIGPFSGAAFLRAPNLHNVVNIRASYAAEAEAWIKHLTEDLHIRSIAIFYQDDAFGRDGLAGVKSGTRQAQHGADGRRHLRAQYQGGRLRADAPQAQRNRKPWS